MVVLSWPCAGTWMLPARLMPRRAWPGAGGGTLGGGLRCALHALGGQRHRVRVPGDRGRGNGRPGGFHARLDAPMTDSRALVVWGQVAAHAAAQGRRASVADVCA